MGRSIGSIVAVETISQKNDDFKGMIIESGICSTPSYVSALGANIEQLGILEEDGFDMLSKVEGITLPTLIFHGATDPFIPVVQAERIQSYSGARSKQFFIIPGGTHDNLAKIGGDLYFQTIKQFTDTICGVNTWRKRRKKQKSAGKE
jgi:dienelactone hydrolase